MSDPVRRGVRTALHLVVSLVTSGAITALLRAFNVNVTDTQFGALAAVLLPVLTTAINGLEDNAGVAFLVPKGPVPTPEEPAPVVPDPSPAPPKKAAAPKTAAKKSPAKKKAG